MTKNPSYIDSTIITQTRDCTPASDKEFEVIRDRLTQYDFTVKDKGDHLVIETPFTSTVNKTWECCYLFKENGQWVWMTATKRWWLLFGLGDPDNRYELLLKLIEEAIAIVNLEIET